MRHFSKSFLFAAFVLSSQQILADAPTKLSSVQSIYKDWKITSESHGDLNQDGTDDVVAVITKTADDPSQFQGHLVVLFGDSSGQLTQIINSAKAVCECSSVKSGPYPFTTEIKKGVLKVNGFWGSRNMTDVVFMWRFQNGAFKLIGSTVSDTDTVADVGGTFQSIVDVNLSTGRRVDTIDTVTAVTKDGEVKSKTSKTKCKIKKTPEIKLKDFSVEEYSSPSCSNG